MPQRSTRFVIAHGAHAWAITETSPKTVQADRCRAGPSLRQALTRASTIDSTEANTPVNTPHEECALGGLTACLTAGTALLSCKRCTCRCHSTPFRRQRTEAGPEAWRTGRVILIVSIKHFALPLPETVQDCTWSGVSASSVDNSPTEI